MLANGSTPKSGLKKTVSHSKFKTILFSLLTVFGPSSLESRPVATSDFSKDRLRMVERQLRGRNIHDPSVLDAMRKVPRHFFVEPEYIQLAYGDTALPIKEGQTISKQHTKF